MFYVYLLSSIADPTQRYVGFTTNLKQRVKSHNEGASVHTQAPALDSRRLSRVLR